MQPQLNTQVESVDGNPSVTQQEASFIAVRPRNQSDTDASLFIGPRRYEYTINVSNGDYKSRRQESEAAIWKEKEPYSNIYNIKTTT